MGLTAVVATRVSPPAGGSITIRAVAVYWRGIAAPRANAAASATAQLARIQRHRDAM